MPKCHKAWTVVIWCRRHAKMSQSMDSGNLTRSNSVITATYKTGERGSQWDGGVIKNYFIRNFMLARASSQNLFVVIYEIRSIKSGPKTKAWSSSNSLGNTVHLLSENKNRLNQLSLSVLSNKATLWSFRPARYISPSRISFLHFEGLPLHRNLEKVLFISLMQKKLGLGRDGSICNGFPSKLG